MMFYRCSDLRPPNAESAVRKDEDEELEPKTFTVEQARQLVATGEIVDLKTAVGMMLL
jgi:hypothetical protein